MKRAIILLTLVFMLVVAFISCNSEYTNEIETRDDHNSEDISVTTDERVISDAESAEPETEDTVITNTEAVSSEELTTEAATTEEVTTEAIMTEAATTEEVTTEAVTTEAVTTEAVTEAPASSGGGGGGGSSSGSGSSGSGGSVTTPDPCKNGHDEQQHEAKAPTCTEAGWNVYVTCNREGCNYTDKGVDIPALDHDKQQHEAKAPTCTEAGWNAYVTCNREGCDYTDKGEDIPALGHDIQQYEAKAPTCTESGWDAYETCKRVGCASSFAKVILPKISHSYNADEICTVCGAQRWIAPSEGISVYYANDISNKAVPVADGVINEGEYGEQVVVIDEPIKMAQAYPDYCLKIDDTSTRPSGGTVEYRFAYDEEHIYIAIKEYGQTFNDDSTTYKSFASRNNYAFNFGFDPEDMTNHISHSVAYGDFCWNGNITYSDGAAYSYKNTNENADVFYSELFVNKYPLSEAEFASDKRTLYAYGDLLSANNGNASSAYVLELEMKLNKKDVIEFFNKHTGTAFSEMPDAMWFFMTTTTYRKGLTSGESKGISKYFVNDIRNYTKTQKDNLFDKYGGLTNPGVEFVPSVIVFADKNEDIIISSQDPCAKGHDLVSHASKEPTCNAIGWDAYDACTRCDYTTIKIIQRIPHDFGEDGMCYCGTEEDPSTLNGEFEAGYAIVNINPPLPVNKKSSGMYNGIYDGIYATCIAVSDGENTALLFTVDVTSIGAAIDRNLKKSITKATGVPAENIIISATHTHTAPSPGLPKNASNNMRWLTQLNTYFADVASKAIDDLAPAEIYKGTETVKGMAFVRRWIYKNGEPGGIWRKYGIDKNQIAEYESEVDNSVQIIRFARDGKKDIIMANLQTHFTDVGNYKDYKDNYSDYISADLADILRTEVQKNDDILFAVYVGASGNVTPLEYVQNSEKIGNYKKTGEKIAQVILEAIPTLEKVQVGKIVATSTTVTTNVRKDDTARVNKAKAALKEVKDKLKSYYDGDKEVYDIVSKEEYGFESIKEVNSIISRNTNYDSTRDHLLGAISFGNLAFIAAPYEMFDTNGMQIKTGSPFEMTFIITNAGGAGAYVPSEEAVKNGGYEVYTAVDEFATYDEDGNVVTKGTAERMVDKFIEMLVEHKAKQNNN